MHHFNMCPLLELQWMNILKRFLRLRRKSMALLYAFIVWISFLFPVSALDDSIHCSLTVDRDAKTYTLQISNAGNKVVTYDRLFMQRLKKNGQIPGFLTVRIQLDPSADPRDFLPLAHVSELIPLPSSFMHNLRSFEVDKHEFKLEPLIEAMKNRGEIKVGQKARFCLSMRVFLDAEHVRFVDVTSDWVDAAP